MAMMKQLIGQIITFYSYKGGTGRTMALANTACLLARRYAAEGSDKKDGVRVVAIDWDFEAPGLHRFLWPYLDSTAKTEFNEAPGCLDLFIELDKGRSEYDSQDFVGNRQRTRERLEAIDIDRFLLSTNIPGLALIKAGRFDDGYARRVGQFNWEAFFQATPGKENKQVLRCTGHLP